MHVVVDGFTCLFNRPFNSSAVAIQAGASASAQDSDYGDLWHSPATCRYWQVHLGVYPLLRIKAHHQFCAASLARHCPHHTGHWKMNEIVEVSQSIFHIFFLCWDCCKRQSPQSPWFRSDIYAAQAFEQRPGISADDAAKPPLSEMPDISHFLAQICGRFPGTTVMGLAPSGFKLQLEDRGNIGYDGMAEVISTLSGRSS